jgi:alpha,alpha-trehalase
MFDDYLERRARDRDEEFVPFDARREYREYVDGKPRYEGVRSFLESRGIELTRGTEDDPPDRESICGLGNRKNAYFQEWLEQRDVRTLPGAEAFVATLQRAGIRTGVFSSSRNAEPVLRSAGVLELFDTKVDGVDLDRYGLEGKPNPAMLLEAAQRLESEPQHTAVVEDAVAGVEAGVRGGFRLVVGVAASGPDAPHAEALRHAGADAVVGALSELRLRGNRITVKTLGSLPSVRQHQESIRCRLRARSPVVFLDYDGTLTPIVDDYREATLADEMRNAVAAVAARFPTALVSGRDLKDLTNLVGLDEVYYAGSHGFDMDGPGGWHDRPEQAETFLPVLDEAEEAIRDAVSGIDGCAIERKTFSIAIHYRQVANHDVEAVQHAVDEVLARHPDLRKGHGKKVFELQPDTDWNKGRAVEWLLQQLDLNGDDVLPLYIGDDVTDEDAFRTLYGRGLGIAVGGGARQTSAEYALEDPRDVRRFLQVLMDSGGTPSDAGYHDDD